jgi:ankyrin repeat protein
VKPIGKTTIELRIDGVTENLECVEAIELACTLAVAHAELVKNRRRTISFGYGKIRTELNGKEIFEISLTLQIVAIPLGNDSIHGGWGGKSGRQLLSSIESAAPNMALAESLRASREALSDPGAMTGKEHLAVDELYKNFKQVVDSLKTKKNTNRELDGALFDACKNGQLEVVKDLLAKGADVDAKGALGATCLIRAINLGHLEVAKELLAQGADVDARNNNGETALLHASQEGQVELVNSLLASGADVNATGNIGGTALMQASYYGHLGVVKALLAGGANVDAKNIDGTSALFMATTRSHLEVVKALLAQGARANTRMSDGFTALMRASQDGNLEILKELLSHGADVNAKNTNGYTPLMLCAYKGRIDVAKELILRGADVNARSNNGDTALKLAGAEEVRALLVSSGARA